MLQENQIEQLEKKNYQKIKELVRISFGLGVNLTSPSRFKDSLRILNVLLVFATLIELYAHCCFIARYFPDILKISECVSTALQTFIAVIKMVYYIFVQRKLFYLLKKVRTHEFIRNFGIFQNDFPINETLKKKAEDIMDSSWKNIRNQLIFYTFCCSIIISNYFFVALFVNMYNVWMNTPNYQHKLPLPALYPAWEDKGMTFPYYHMQMLFGGCAVYIAGMCAVSFDGVFIVLSVHAVGLIKLLNVMIENSTSPDVPKERRVEYLHYCIDQYQRISDFIITIRGVYKHISITQFLLSLLVWGIVLFQMSVGLESDKMTLVRMIMYISAAGYEIVLYCYNGQRITSECEKIPMALYSCEWYDESKDFKLLIRMMLLRTSRMVYMPISWFTTMTLPTLMAMIKTSGSYFLLLRNLTE